MSTNNMTACHELPVITTPVRCIRVTRMTSDDIQDHQEKTCTEHKSKNVLIHCTLNLTVKKVMKWLNHSLLRRNHCKINQITHNVKITILVTVVKRTSCKKSCRKSETWLKKLIIKWLSRCLNQNKNIQLNCENQHTSVCLAFLRCHQD